MTNDIGDPFTHRPCQNRVERLGRLFVRFLDFMGNACRFEQLARAVQFAYKARLPIARNGLTDFAQRHTPDLLDLSKFLSTTRGIFRDQATSQFALEGDHREGLSQQIMQISCQAQALFLAENGRPCMQGYLYCRPLPLPDLITRLACEA